VKISLVLIDDKAVEKLLLHPLQPTSPIFEVLMIVNTPFASGLNLLCKEERVIKSLEQIVAKLAVLDSKDIKMIRSSATGIKSLLFKEK